MTGYRKAVIVAAGLSSRLYPLTRSLPKGLLRVGGEALLARSVGLLRGSGVERISMVVGFERRKLAEALGGEGIGYVFNPFYARSNNLASLWFARDWVGGDPFLYLHSDIVYHPGILDAVLGYDRGADSLLSVDFGSCDPEAMKVSLSPKGRLIESNKHIPADEAAGEWIGLARFGGRAVQILFDTLDEVLDEGLLDAYDTAAFTRMAEAGEPIETVGTDGLPWMEIDSAEDLEAARGLFEEPPPPDSERPAR